jgi:thiol-disulfide isomerase/thioredoxin
METDFKKPRRILRVRALVAAVAGSMIAGQTGAEAQQPPNIIGLSPLYSLPGATGWINSQPLTAKELKGKVVLVDFWTYSCINCLRSLPYIRA